MIGIESASFAGLTLKDVPMLMNTTICVHAQTANNFSRLLTFETARLPSQTARLRLET